MEDPYSPDARPSIIRTFLTLKRTPNFYLTAQCQPVFKTARVECVRKATTVMNALETSVLSLAKNLSGAKWKESYEILLDCQRRTQSEGTLQNGTTMLLDLVVEFQVQGKRDVAVELRRLVEDSQNDNSMLLLLALCARKSDSPVGCKSNLFPFLPANEPVQERRFARTPLFPSRDPKLNPFENLECTTVASLTDHYDFVLEAAKKFLRRRVFDVPKSGCSPSELNTSTSGGKRISSVQGETKSAPPPPRRRDWPDIVLPDDKGHVPREIQEILHFLMNGPESRKNETISIVPQTGRNCDEMEKRRTRHASSCGACSKRETEFIVSAGLLEGCVRWGTGHNRSVDDLRNRAVSCGSLYRVLVCFSVTYSHYSNRVLSSIALFSEDMAQVYLLRILEVLSSNLEPEVVRSALVFAAEQSKDDMLATLEVLAAIEQSSGSACAILDILHEALPKSQGADVIQKLFHVALGPYMEMIWDWFFHASSARDVGSEFFGTSLGKDVTDSEFLCHLRGTGQSQKHPKDVNCVPEMFRLESALFILRAGRSRGLLEMLSPNDPLLHMNPPLFSDRLSMVILNEIAFKLTRLAMSLEDENIGVLENTHVKSLSRDSSLLSSELAEDRCEVAEVKAKKSTSNTKGFEKGIFFRTPCEERNETVAARDRSQLFSFRYTAQGSNSTSCTMPANIETSSSLHTFLERMIIGNLRRIDLFTQRKILNHFVAELKILEQLRLLGDFALLGAGDFADVLVEQICDADATSSEHEKFITRRVTAARTFYGTAGPGGVAFRKRRHLATCLRTALGVVNNDYGALSDKFSISVGSSEMSKTALWESQMKVEYQVDFPLNLIISSDALAMYSKIFDFFLSVRRAQRCLRSLFMVTRRNSVLRSSAKPWNRSFLSKRNCRVSLWQFCWHAEHFVSIVGGFEFNQIHGLSWTGFASSWSGISSIWELRDEHMNYLRDSIRRVLLGERQKSVMNVITGALKIIFSVESNITRVIENASESSVVEETNIIELLFSSTEGLKRRSAFLIDVLEKLVANGSHPHLEDFLTRLNFNSYYKSEKL